MKRFLVVLGLFALLLSGAPEAHAQVSVAIYCYQGPTNPQWAPCTSTLPLPVSSGGAAAVIGITPTDRTVTSATGASQTVMAANASRHSLTIENTGNANCGINPTGGTAVIGGAGTLTLGPLGAYTPLIPTLSAVTAICTSGQPLYANES